jgi:phage gp29-like protein
MMFSLFARRRNGKNRASGEQAPSLSKLSLEALSYPSGARAFWGEGISLEVYDEMLTDPLIRAALTIKKLGTLAVPWRILPYDESPASRERREFIQYVFAEMTGSPEQILFDAMDALAKGYAVMEKIYVPDEGRFRGKVRLGSVKPKDPALFGFEVDEFLNLRALTLHLPGEAPRRLPREKFVIYAHNRRYGAPTGESDLKSVYRSWCLKRELIKQWSAHLEKFASPTVLGKFKRGLPEEAQRELLNALQRIQRQSAVVHPDDIEVRLLEGGSEGRGAYLEAIEYHNREIARAILGGTLTTDDSRKVGSLALGKVHLQVLVMQLAGLRRALAEQVMNEQIIRPLIDINYGGGHYPVFAFDEPDLDVFRTGQVVS